MQPVVRANSIIAVRVFTRVASFCDPGWTFSLPGTTYNSLFYPEDKDHMLHTRTAWVGSEAAAETAAAAALRLRFFLWNSSPTSPRDARSGVAIACTCACVCMFVCVYTHYKRTRARTHTHTSTHIASPCTSEMACRSSESSAKSKTLAFSARCIRQLGLPRRAPTTCT